MFRDPNNMKLTEEQLQKAQKAKAAAFAALAARQTEFTKSLTANMGDELEEHIRTFSDVPPFNRMLLEYAGAAILRMNILEIVMAPIIQLAEVKGLGAAIVFAERITVLNHDRDILNLFMIQISKLLPDQYYIEGYTAAHLQISLANLMNIFSFEYQLFNVLSIRNDDVLLNIEKNYRLREEMANLAKAYANKILQYLHDVARKENVDLEQLKRKFLAEEDRASVATRWREVMQHRRQMQDDASLARNHLVETLRVIDHNIQALLSAEKPNESALELWLNKAIQIATNPDYSSIIIRIIGTERFFSPDYKYPLCIKEELVAQIERYVALRACSQIFDSLKRLGSTISIEDLQVLPPRSRMTLALTLERNAGSRLSLIVKDCTPDMLAYLSMLLTLKNEFPSLNVKLLQKWPVDELKKRLTTLSTLGQKIADVHKVFDFDINLLLTFPQPPLDPAVAYLIFDAPHRNLIFDQAVLRGLFKLNKPIAPEVVALISGSRHCYDIIRLIYLLPVDVIQSVMTGDDAVGSIEAVKYFVSRTNAVEVTLMQKLLINPYFLECFREKKDLRNIDIILGHQMPLERINAIYTENGIECVVKKYCSVAQQCRIPPHLLPDVQEILVHLKKQPSPEFLAALAVPTVLQAYKYRFIDIFFLESATPENLQLIERYYQKARAQKISYVRDPRFIAMLGNKISPSMSQTIWANVEIPEKPPAASHKKTFHR